MTAARRAPLGASGFVWRRVELPVPVDQARVQAFFAAVATLPGGPVVACELIGNAGTVRWRIGALPGALRDVQALALAHLPGVRLVRQSGMAADAELFRDDLGTDGAVAVANLHFRRRAGAALPSDSAEAVTRSLLAVLAATRRDETVRVQLVLGGRQRPHEPDPPVGTATAVRRQTEAAQREHGFWSSLRVGAAAPHLERARGLVLAISAALRGLETPQVRLQVWRSTVRALVEVRPPWLVANVLRPAEIPALLGWPLCDGLPGLAPQHPRLLPAPAAVASAPESNHGRIVGRAASEPSRPVTLSAEASLRHLHVLGPTGVGKSTLLAHLALQDAVAGRRVVVIDPKGDLVTDIATRLPAHLVRRTVILDAADAQPVGVNPLAGGQSPDLAADLLLGVFRSLYADSWGPRTQDILHASLLSLARRGDASLAMVPLLLTNPGFRRSVTGAVVQRDPLGLGAFWAWYEALSEAERRQAIAPLMNKLRPILLRPQLRAVFGQRSPKFAWHQIFAAADAGNVQEPGPRIVLVSLAKGALGQEASQLLGSVIVSLIWQAALERIRLPERQRHAVMLHIDEVQDYLRLPGDLGAALAQARGLGLGLTLSHQHLGQLPKALLAGVMANARSRIAFSLPREDARAIAALSAGLLEAEDYQQLPAYQAYASLLADGQTQPPLSLRTEPLPAALRHPEQVWQASRRRYGQTLSAVEGDLARLAGLTSPSNDTATRHAPQPTDDIGRVRRPPGTSSTDDGQNGGAA
ncbi:hypothetical protein CHIBA101_0078 [Actinomyces sp. Chiba101]|uniref:helicase HerA domain-containing protein n=1 Tax=Actinomyces TaxID=1654 RepID=UPI000974E0CD|nr:MULTISPECIES: DUF87 domain-containing protein [Actinomyces]BAW91955.1 hypothetical protein CHIBA101_0078 [Actinomyces sp. Chiba101]GAV95117.1 hypothetical protein ADENT20671_1897 [Actinomyces denticolens]SUU12377.1 Type IV secretory pathway, VirD4 components [Actinomyces denticolens]